MGTIEHWKKLKFEPNDLEATAVQTVMQIPPGTILKGKNNPYPEVTVLPPIGFQIQFNGLVIALKALYGTGYIRPHLFCSRFTQ